MTVSTVAPAATEAIAASPGSNLRMIANEVTRGLRLRWVYRATLLPELFGGLAMYLMVQYFVGDGHTSTSWSPRPSRGCSRTSWATGS